MAKTKTLVETQGSSRYAAFVLLAISFTVVAYLELAVALEWVTAREPTLLAMILGSFFWENIAVLGAFFYYKQNKEISLHTIVVLALVTILSVAGFFWPLARTPLFLNAAGWLGITIIAWLAVLLCCLSQIGEPSPAPVARARARN